MKKFYENKRILITGHNGFKGTWLTKILTLFGAEVLGYSTEAHSTNQFFKKSNLENEIHSIHGDVRDLTKLQEVFKKFKPEIVFHLAAQPLVRESYLNPLETYETNVMGTVNLLECIRTSDSVKSVINVTTDKVYENKEWEWGYRENENLNGYDPYSNSKSCSEIITESYKKSFLSEGDVSISTARAGNVIGGGDYSPDRIVPDCIKYAFENKKIKVRNPHSIRPYQHVLDPLFAYLLLAEKQYFNKSIEGSYNIGPDDSDCISTSRLVNLFCDLWGNECNWISTNNEGPHEANYLKLDCSKIKKNLDWKPTWNINSAIAHTISWAKQVENGESVDIVMEKQIKKFFNEVGQEI